MSPRCLCEWVDDGGGLDCFDRALTEAIIDAAVVGEGETENGWTLTILSVNDLRSAELHRQHFAIDGATDVMSFPDGSVDPELQRRRIGDLVVCPQIAAIAVAQSTNPQAMISHELALYVLHGALHCLGWDDQDPQDRAEMWERQRQILAPFAIAAEDYEHP